ncbi:MAG: D-tyrosyl-tRNA(Tyr) deacylase [Cirrosporium novae-zelandiae]|nr:MAG: D-tyrosyl-tRNA(Tyr) deacylase [Cirrosporium novae-zelandiae]
MKAIVQRVVSASVTVDKELISTIGKGLLVFAAVAPEDTTKEVESMASKVLNLKIWPDESGAGWKKNVREIDGEVLCVSQFTLLANTKKGNKPDFHGAAPPNRARDLYNQFFAKVQEKYSEDKVKNGVFQAMMQVGSVNDGPVGVDYHSADAAVTLEINTNPPPKPEKKKKEGESSETNPDGRKIITFTLPDSLLE